MKRLIEALRKAEIFKQLNVTSGRDEIVYADGVKSNRELMISMFELLGRSHKLKLFENG